MSLLGRTSVVSAATLSSRVLGFARDAATAAILGAGPVADALTAALALPLLARRLLAEGAFNLALIPALARAEREAAGAPRAVASAALLLLAGTLLVLSALAAVFMPQLIRLLAPGFTPDGPRADVAVLCGRVGVLYLPLSGLAAIYGGVANNAQRVLLPALAPVAANLTVLAVIAALLLDHQVASDTAAFAIAVATVVAGISQWLLMMRAARGCPAAPQWSGLLALLRPGSHGAAGAQRVAGDALPPVLRADVREADQEESPHAPGDDCTPQPSAARRATAQRRVAGSHAPEAEARVSGIPGADGAAAAAASFRADTRTPWRVAIGVLRAASPALLFAGLSQFRLIIAAALASGSEGAVAALNYAQRLVDLPLGLVGASAGAVLVPLLARHAAQRASAPAEPGAARSLLEPAEGHRQAALAASNGMLTALAFALPAAVGLAVLAEPIVTVLFQRGAFDAHDTALTAKLLAVLALALPAQGLERILSATAATVGLVQAAERIALASLVVCLGCGALGVAGYGPLGAAAGVALSAVLSVGVFVGLLAHRQALALPARMSATLAGLALAAGLMGGTVALAAQLWPVPATGTVPAILRLGALVGLGVVVYGLCGLALKRGVERRWPAAEAATDR